MRYSMPLIGLLALTMPYPAAAQMGPSPDGRYKECVKRLDLVPLSQAAGFELAIKWYRRSGSAEQGFEYSRESLSFFVKDPSRRDFVLWKGWDADASKKGRDPDLICSQGQGTQSLIIRENAGLPSAPFGITFPPNDGWKVNPNLPLKGNKGTLYSQCVAADNVLRSMKGSSPGCERYDYRGYIAKIRDEGYALKTVLKPSAIRGFLMVFSKGDVGMLAVVSGDGLVTHSTPLFEYEEASGFLESIHRTPTR